MSVSLYDFKVVRPQFEERQETLLDWLVHAHTQSQMQTSSAIDAKAFETALREKLFSLGLGENKIQKRGFVLEDFNHRNWDKMDIYPVSSNPQGHGLGKRMALYDRLVSSTFEQIYSSQAPLPAHLIHVTCTGYVAPSPAQKLVAGRSQGSRCIVTHAYHMGCYGSIPSIRIAQGHYLARNETSDIVHTEVCSLHVNPTLSSTEQLVIQSLFADGFIKYSVGKSGTAPGLKLLSIHEEVLDQTSSKMGWVCEEWGFKMSISKDIPVILRKSLKPYLERLARLANIPLASLAKAHYAIHPGGPKIIEQIAQLLELTDEGIAHSQGVLRDYGNMSSATLPHVWDRILKDPKIQPGELVVGLAFGPGLSICGALFTKES